MTPGRLGLGLSLGTATLGLAGLLAGRNWIAAGVAALPALLWLWGEWKNRRWSPILGLGTWTTLAMVLMLSQNGPGWGILLLVGALLAWDANHFRRLVAAVGRIEDETVLWARYRRRLLLIGALGAGLATVGALARLNISFGVAAGLALIAMVGLSRAIRFLRRASE